MDDRLLVIVDQSRDDLFTTLRRDDDDSVAVMRDRRQPGAAPGRFAIERRLRAVGHDLRALGLAVVAPHGQRAQADVVARAAFLRTLPLFAAFSLAELIELADHIDERALRRNRTLFHEGETSAEMFVVRQGIVLISKEVTPRVEKVLARMKPGEFFGEMNLFGCLPRSATARAETDIELIVLQRATLEKMLAMKPAAVLAFFTAMVREFCTRLAATDDLVSEVTRWGLEAGVQAFALGQRHHVVGQAADGFRLGLGRLDALVAEEGDEHVAKHGRAVLADPAQPEAMVTVPHRTTPPPRLSVPRMLGSMRMPIESPSAASAVLISSMDFSPRFFTCSRSASVFWARSATTWISAFLSALMARAGSGSSSSGLLSASRRYSSPDAPSVSASSTGAPAA